MNATQSLPSRIVYRVSCDGYLLGYASDRDEAEEVRDAHANRNGRQITQGYTIDVELREEAT